MAREYTIASKYKEQIEIYLSELVESLAKYGATKEVFRDKTNSFIFTPSKQYEGSFDLKIEGVEFYERILGAALNALFMTIK
jgi:hypothetical protein